MKLKNVKASFKDRKGKLYIDCAECVRGGNGIEEDKCAAGWSTKIINRGGCFCGELLPYFDIETVKER